LRVRFGWDIKFTFIIVISLGLRGATLGPLSFQAALEASLVSARASIVRCQSILAAWVMRRHLPLK